MFVKTDLRPPVLQYIDSAFFKKALANFLDEFEDPDVSLSQALNVFRRVGPPRSAEEDYYITSVLGISFDYDEAGFTTPNPRVFLDEFIDAVARNPDVLAYDLDEDKGHALLDAVEAGIAAGVKAYPSWVSEPAPNVDMTKSMARLYYAMFMASSLEDAEIYLGPGTTIDSPGILAAQVREMYEEMFEVIDDRFHEQSRHCATSACRAFWAHFGFQIDGESFPIIWW